MNKLKKINFLKVTWIAGIFAFLIFIFLIVYDYKVNYEYINYNYLYFYDCNSSICAITSSNLKKKYYSKFACGYKMCPSIVKKLGDKYVVLLKNDKYYLYDYINGKVLNKDYDNYEIFNDKYFIVNKNNKYGIIDEDNKVLLEPLYDTLGIKKDDELIGYNSKNIIASKDNKYGIISYVDGTIIEEFKYTKDDIESLNKIINS